MDRPGPSASTPVLSCRRGGPGRCGSIASRRATGDRWIGVLRGRGRPGGCRGAARPGTAGGAPRGTRHLWVHELVGAAGARPAGRRPRAGSTAVEANPASDLLVLESGALSRCASWSSTTPGRAGRRWTSPRGSRPVTAGTRHCARKGRRRADRRLHHLPRGGRGLLRHSPPGPGPPAGVLDLAGADLRPGPTTPGARSTTRRSAAGRAWCSRPSRSSPPSRRWPRPTACPGRSCCSPRGAGASTRPVAGRAGRAPRRVLPALCGRYEGVDQRVADHLVDGELSVGDFVLAGGELAALVVVEAVTRLLPGRPGQRRLGQRGELQPTDCSSTPSTPRPADLPGLGGARGAAIGGPRPGGPLAPGPGPEAARWTVGPN